MHLTINSLAPRTTEKKFHGDKAPGWTLLNKSFCLTLEDFCLSVCSLFKIYEVVRRVYCQGMMDNTRQKVARAGRTCATASLLLRTVYESLLLVFPTSTSNLALSPQGLARDTC